MIRKFNYRNRAKEVYFLERLRLLMRGFHFYHFRFFQAAIGLAAFHFLHKTTVVKRAGEAAFHQLAPAETLLYNHPGNGNGIKKNK